MNKDEIVTKHDLETSINDLEKRLSNDFEVKMRKILTEELPIILENKFVTKQALAEAAK